MENSSIASITDGAVILATALLEATPIEVFNAFTQPQEIERWWGSEDLYRMNNWVADTKDGGEYSVVVTRPNGTKYPASGKFLKVDPPHLLSHTRIYQWGHPIIGDLETIITYHFQSTETGCKLIVRHDGFDGFKAAADEHAEGWIRVLNWLVLHFSTMTNSN
jgi:uncharacterized protein YndB with AHSA1/START domain